MNKTTKIVGIVAAAVVLIAIVITSYMSGESVTVEGSLEAAGLFLAGILTALGWRRGGTALLILALAGSQAACAAHPWQIASGAIGAAQAAIDEAEPLIPADVDGRDEAIDITRAALAFGEDMIETWEDDTERPMAWLKWVSCALRGIMLVIDLLQRCGVPIPPAVQMAMAGIAGMVGLVL